MAPQPNEPTLADDLIEALGEAVAHAEGRRDLATRTHPAQPSTYAPSASASTSAEPNSPPASASTPAPCKTGEQGRGTPDRTARILLKVIEANPAVVEDVLRENVAA